MFEIIDYIPDIILKPDYIGVNPNEQGLSVELIKKYADNVLIGIKLDAEEDIYMFLLCMMYRRLKSQGDCIAEELRYSLLTMRNGK